MHSRASRAFVGLLAVALCASTTLVLGAAAPASAAGFTSDDIVVVRVGTGNSPLSNAATEVFLDEYTPAGTLVQSIALPTSAVGSNRRLTMSGAASSEGALALSADGRYLSLARVRRRSRDCATVASTSTATAARVVARVDGNGLVDSSTAITDAFSGADIRGAVTDDGSRFWVVGASGGVRLAPLGSPGTTTQINSAAPTNLRVAGITDGQLHVSTGSAPAGVHAVGSGLPTTGGQTPALLAASPSPYGFVALDRDPGVPGVDTLYVADDSASGGIVKFSFDGTTWTARGSFRPDGSGVRGLTGAITPSGVTLYATTSTAANQLVMVSDSAGFDAPIAATSTTLQTAAPNTVFRGVAFAPSGGDGENVAPTISTQPQDTTIVSGATATLTVAASGTGPLSYQWYTGVAGDTSTPVGSDAASFTTPPLTTTTSYWVRVTGPGGAVDSRTATVTVGAAPPACSTAVVTVGSVQGTGDISPAAGQTVSVRGTVVADYEGPQPALRGFYLQDAGDGDAATSDGIFVFDNGANLVANGDVVQVTGPVSEFQGQTQLTASAAGVQSCDQQATVTPVDVTLPRASATDLEPYEGMLVRLHQTVFVTEHFQLGRFGQVVVSSGDRLRQPTADIRATDQAAVQAAQQANDLNRLIIDDASQGQNPDPIVFGRGGQPLSAGNTLRGGDSLTDAVGVLTYTWAGNAASGNAYRLRPVGALGGSAVFEPVNHRPTAPPDVGSRWHQGRQRQPAQLLQHVHRLHVRYRGWTGRLPRRQQRRRVPASAGQGGRVAAVPRRRRHRLHGDGERRVRPDQRGAGARRRPQRRRWPGNVGVRRSRRRTRRRRRRRNRCHQGRVAVPDRVGVAGARRDVRRPEPRVRAPTRRPDLRDSSRGPVHGDRQPLQVQGLVPDDDRPRQRSRATGRPAGTPAERRRPRSWPAG